MSTRSFAFNRSFLKKFLTSILTVVLFTAATKSSAQISCDNPGVMVGNDNIVFAGVKYDYPSAGQSTWYYCVTSGSRPAISHVTFKLCYEECCLNDKLLDYGTWGPDYDDFNSGDGLPEVGTDPTTGVNGLKFDEGFDEEESRSYYFVLDGNYAVGNITVASKGGSGFDLGVISGPSPDCDFNEECNLGVTGTKTDVTCNGESNGSIDITVTGNIGSVSYSWSDGSTNGDRSGLAPGVYTVIVTEGDCEATETYTIEEPAVLGITETHVDVTTVGGNNGSIDITVTGGTPPYSYLWDDGPTVEDRTGLAAGCYSVIVTDDHGCTTTIRVCIEEPSCELDVTGNKIDITCNGDENGSIDITVTGNSGPVTYAWSDGATVEDRSGLAPGSYSVTVSTEDGCEAEASFTIEEPAVLGITETHVDVTTVGGNNGSIDITVTGGTPPYSYLWDDGPTVEDRTGLAAGCYSVTVTDDNGCTTTIRVCIEEPLCELDVTGNKIDITCNGDKNGSIDITVTGNSGPVTYAWSDGSTVEDRSGLAPGSYSVTVSTEDGCEAEASFTIEEPAVLGITETHVDVSTPGGSDGSIDITVTGGTAPYSYLWDDGSTDEDRTGLSAGCYSVTVTDGNGCTNTIRVCIEEAKCDISVTGKVTHICCYGATTGEIDITVTGATGAVTYLWSDGSTNGDRTGLAAGTYSVNVRDEKGCTTTASFTIKQAKKLKISYVKTDATSNINCNGTATVTPTGGTKPYTITWNDGFVGATRNNLCAGVYTVTVKDKYGCTVTCKIRINCVAPGIAAVSAGTSESSAVTSVGGVKVSVAPNPTKGLVKVSFNAIVKGNASINIYAANGKLVQTSKLAVVEGMNYREINLSGNPSGSYLVQVVSGNDTKSVKIILEK